MSYISKLFTTGAIRKTPNRVIQEILSHIKGTNMTIVEFGAGKGEITSAILNDTERKTDQYFAFELDAAACGKLAIHCPAAKIINEDVFNFENQLSAGVLADYFICSIPISFYQREKVTWLLSKMKERLKPEGKIIVVFSALWLVPFFKKHSVTGTVKAYFSFPPYLLYFDPA